MKCCKIRKYIALRSLHFLYMFILRAEIVTIFQPKMITISARNTRLYYIHFEINGVSCNLIGSQECDFSTNTLLAVRFVLKSDLLPTNHIRVLTSANQSYLIIRFKQSMNFKKNVIFIRFIEKTNLAVKD